MSLQKRNSFWNINEQRINLVTVNYITNQIVNMNYTLLSNEWVFQSAAKVEEAISDVIKIKEPLKFNYYHCNNQRLRILKTNNCM